MLKFSTPLASLAYLNPCLLAQTIAQTGDGELHAWLESVDQFIDGARIERDFKDRFRRVLKGESTWESKPLKGVRAGLVDLFPTMRHPEGWWQVVRNSKWLPFSPSLPKSEPLNGFKKVGKQGNVELDLTQPLDLSLLIPNSDPDESWGIREALHQLYAALKAGEVKKYKINIHKLPSQVRGWREFLSRVPPGNVPFEQLVTFFNACQNGDASMETISKILNHPQGLELCERAVTHGYFFEEGLQFCLSCKDPITAGRQIENKIRRFRRGPTDPKVLRNLSDMEKFALYTLVKDFLNKQEREIPAHVLFKIPSYTLFLDYFGLVSRFNWFGDFSTVFDSHSPIYKLMTVRYVASQWYPLKDWENQKLFFSPIDALCFLDRLRLRHGLQESLLQRAFEAILNADRKSIQVFHYALGLANTPKKVEATVMLLESGLGVEEIVDVIFDSSDPLEQALLFKTSYPLFAADLTLKESYESLSNGEKAALYVVCYNLHLRFQRKDVGYGYSCVFPPFSTFNIYLNIESRTSRESRPFSLFTLFDSISGPLRTDHVVERYLSKRDPSSAFDLFMVLARDIPYLTKKLYQRVYQSFQRVDREVIGAFLQNIFPELSEEDFAAALELLEAGIPLKGGLFRTYAKTPQRLRKINRIQKRATELEQGDDLQSLEDPFEILAAYEVIRNVKNEKNESLSLDEVVRIMQLVWTNYVPPSTSIFSARIKFRVPMLSWRFGEKVDRKTLGELVETLRVISDIENVELIVREIAMKIDLKPELQGIIGRVNILEMVEVLIEVILTERVADGTIKMRSITQLERTYLYYLFLISTWHAREAGIELSTELEDVRKDLLRYHLKASEQEGMDALRAIGRFYEILHERLQRSCGPKMMPSYFLKIKKWIEHALARAEKIESDKVMEVTVKPCRTIMDVFLGYVTDNCLGRPDYAQYFLSEEGFMPYRILVNGKWRGSLMTFTKVFGNEEKYLVLTGIDPQRDLKINPSVFIEKLLGAFQRFIKTNDQDNRYDEILFPKLTGTQSSRQGLIPPEIEKRCELERVFFFPWGFPRRGPDYSAHPFYYEHRDFLVVPHQHRKGTLEK